MRLGLTFLGLDNRMRTIEDGFFKRMSLVVRKLLKLLMLSGE